MIRKTTILWCFLDHFFVHKIKEIQKKLPVKSTCYNNTPL
ncbi:hypothetical protein FM106_15215 [Brachybacterium faecium]|nr:hypothetical protein FM106_15215 [Brachybacterium faecium]